MDRKEDQIETGSDGFQYRRAIACRQSGGYMRQGISVSPLLTNEHIEETIEGIPRVLNALA